MSEDGNTGRLRSQIMEFLTFDTPASHGVAREVFSGITYPLFREYGQPATIVDVGANVGAASLYFSANYPGAKVFSFEPAPEAYELLQKNTAESHNVRTFKFGLSDVNARVPLYDGLGEPIAASVLAKHGGESHSTEVELRNAAEVLQGLGITAIDFLKIDTEGCELPILRSVYPVIPFRVLFVEYHDRDDRLELDRMLRDTHVLFHGRAITPDRGEFCYLSKSML